MPRRRSTFRFARATLTLSVAFALIAQIAIVLLPTSQAGATGPSGPGVFASGVQLTANQSISSPNGEFTLVMQGDGNLVEYDGSTAAWASGTSGSGYYALMQGDGNLVVYNASNTPEWASNTSGDAGADLVLADSGVLSVDSNTGTMLWAEPNVLLPNTQLPANQSISSPNGEFTLVMQGDGNLVEYDGSTAAWASGTSGSGYYALMQGDGNLVVYNASNTPEWASNTSGDAGADLVLADSGVLSVDSNTGTMLWAEPNVLLPNTQLPANQSISSPNGEFTLVMQGDGNLVEYDGSTAAWASGTSGSGYYALMQGDGNLVVYNASNTPEWASNTSGDAGADLVLADSGVLSVDSNTGTMLWAEPNVLLPNTQLPANQSISSPNGEFTLVMQGDGNLVEYDGSTAAWASGTSGSGYYALMQGDGNLVVYNASNTPEWASNTSGDAGADLVLADSGVLSVDSSAGGVVWQTTLPGPVVTGVSPSSGATAGGTEVTITGTGLASASAVDFGSTPATIEGDTPTSVTAISPPGTGTVEVTIVTPSGTSTTTPADQYSYTNAPVISSLSPTSGPIAGGTNVTITGSDFTNATSVDFGSTPAASFDLVSNSELTAVTPAEVAGTVEVTVTTAHGTSGTTAADQFIYGSSTGSCTDTWVGTDNSSWSDANNWSEDEVPGSSDVACIPNGTPNLPVELDSSAAVGSIINDGGLQDAGDLDLSGASESTSSGSFDLSGTISGPGNLTLTGSVNVGGPGILDGPGTVTVASSATLDVNGELYLDAQGASLINQGSFTIDSGVVGIGSGSTFTNQGTLTLDANTELGGGCAQTGPVVPAGLMTNTGTIVADSDLADPATLGSYSGAYNCLVLNNTGSIQVAANDQLYLSGTVNLNSGSSVSVPSSATLNEQGYLVANTSLSINNLGLHGTISGPGNLTLTGSVNVGGPGILDGPGTVTVASSATLDVNGELYLDAQGASLINQGSFTIDSGVVGIGSGSTFTNQGTLTLDANTELGGGCAQTGPVVPAGLMTNTGTIVADSDLADPATLGSYSGAYNCLVLNNTGSIQVAANDQLYLSGTVNLNSGSSVSVPSSATLNEQGYLVANTSLSINNLGLHGTISGPGNLTLTGSVNVGGPGILDGPGTVTVASSATLDVNGELYLDAQGASLINQGSFTIDSGVVGIGSGSTFTNQGTLTLDANTELGGGCAQTGPVVPAGLMTNTGTIVADSDLADPATLGSYSGAYNCLVLNNTGSIQVAANDQLYLSGTVNLNSGSSVSVPSSATLNEQGYLVANTSLSINNLGLHGTISGPGNLTLTGSVNVGGPGILDGPGTVTVASSATLDVNGELYLDAQGASLINQGSFTIDSGVVGIGSGSTFTNQGTLTLDANTELGGGCAQTGPVVPAGLMTNTGTIVADSDLADPATLGSYSGAYNCLVLNNTGSIQVAANDQLDLSGTVNLNSGSSVSVPSSATLNVDGTVSLNSGASLTVSTGASLGIEGSLDLNPGSTLVAQGTVDDTGLLYFGKTATLSALDLNGAIEVSSGDVANVNFASSPTGIVVLDGPSNFGHIASTGTVDLSGLRLDFQSDFYPGCGLSITAITATSFTGFFTYISGGNLPPGGSWNPSGTPTSTGAFVSCPVPAAPTAQTYGTGSSLDAVNPSGYQAEPVNTATGAYNTTETDAKLAGLGIPFSFTRSYSSDNPYSGPFGPGWTDSMNVFLSAGSGTETLSDEDGQQTVFTSTGGDAYQGPPGSLSTLSAVSGGGWLLTRHDQSQLVFNASGQLTSETDRSGIGLTLAYNSAGQLASVTDNAGRTVTFSYNGSGLLTTMSLPLARTVSYAYNTDGELSSVTDAAGGVTSYTYNAAGLLATITDQNGHQVVANTYDDSGRVVSQVNSLGKTATFSYASGVTTYTDPNGNQWQDVYQGNVLVERIDPLGGVTSYNYDANLNLISTTNPNGNTTTYTYDNNANMLSETTALNERTTYTYDALNDVTSVTDPLGNTTTYTYDAKGNLLSTTDPNGNITTYVRDPTTGAVTSVTDPNGHTTTYTYDAAGNLTSVTDPLGHETTYTYDAAGRKTSATNALGQTITYTYDALDRLTSVSNPDGDVTTYTYDAVGNRTAVETPNGHTTTYAYDPDNRLTSVTASGDATTTYTYDDNGNRVSKTNGDGHTTTYTYDAAGNLTSVTDPLGRTTTYTYDADGNLLTKTDALGEVTTYAYDADNQLTSVAYSDATPAVTYAYDADGRRTSMTDGTGTTTFAYDADSNLLTRATPSGTFTYTYDPDGNILTRTYPDGTTVTDTYDADERLSSVTTNGATTTYSYDGVSQLTTATLPNGVVETTTYDPAGYVASVVDKNGSSVITSRTYTYDADGNPTTIVTQSETDTYTYDAQDRVTSACYGASCANGHITYTYDPVGNRTQMVDNGATTTYTYDAANELTSSTTSAGTTTYTYDADGRRTEADAPSGTTSDTWNAANELTGVTTPSSTTTTTYDGDGNRTSTTTAGVTTIFVYDTNGPLPQLVEELNGSSELRSYVWGEGLLSMKAGGSTYYVAHDALGSVIGLTSSTLATEETFTYDPFGNALSTTLVDPNAPSIPLRFDAGYLDATGLYSFGARELDSTTGSFLSTDPLGQNPTQPAISAYLFVGDEPTVMVDPSGMIPELSASDCAYLDQGLPGTCAGVNGYANGFNEVTQLAQNAPGGPDPSDVTGASDFPYQNSLPVEATNATGEVVQVVGLTRFFVDLFGTSDNIQQGYGYDNSMK